ncbi:MAG: FHA domain-containing protein [Planctomycetota bacterium]
MPARLRLHITEKIDEVYTVSDGMTLGRSDDADVVLLDRAISRIHARVEERDGTFWIVDAGSSNGILINGEKLPECNLEEGMQLTIGNKSLTYTEAEPLPPEPSFVVDLTKKPLASYPMEEIIASDDVLLKIPTIEPLMEMVYEIVSQMVINSPLQGEAEARFITGVQDAVRNGAMHGNQWNPGKVLTLRYARDAEKVVALIGDKGEGFDYRAVLAESRKVGRDTKVRDEFLSGDGSGKGIVRMLAAVDAVEFNETGNQVILTKFVDGSGAVSKWDPAEEKTTVAKKQPGADESVELEPIDPAELDAFLEKEGGADPAPAEDAPTEDEPDELEL